MAIKWEELSKSEQAIVNIAKQIIEVPMDKFLHKYYHPYSYYVIRNRALVGADGLKPVQKRILFSMWEAKLKYNAPHLKAATVAGNVMGNYHPHGNTSIEEALARMAQKFSLRVPLIDEHGTVGDNTGDRPAAARYWEARLTKAAGELLKELDDNALPMGLNFDGSKPEPALLPVRWPAVLINGTEGIAVGYASNIFPHNPSEVMDAIMAYIDNPELTIDELLKIMPGPDFPTGGEIIAPETLRDMYLNGNGSFVLRGKYKVENLSRGRSRIIFYELPYQVSANDVIKRINAIKKKPTKTVNFPEITDAKDLSDLDNGLRLAITIKSGSNAKAVVEKLYKLTPASKSYSLNETVLDHGSPTQFNIFEIFDQFLDLRKTVIVNTTRSKLEKAEKELKNNKGLMIVIADIDTTLDIIKNSENDNEASIKLQEHFSIEETQAQYILSLQLRRITRADRTSIHERNQEIENEIKHNSLVLNDLATFNEELKQQLLDTKEIIKDDRRTLINDKTAEELKEDEQQTKALANALTKKLKYDLTLYMDNSLVKVIDKSSAAPAVKIPYSYKLQANTGEQLFAVLADGSGVQFPDTYIPFDVVSKKDTIGIDSNFVGIGKTILNKKDVGLLIVTSFGNVALINGKFPQSAEDVSVVQLQPNEKVIKAQWLVNSNLTDNLFIVSSDGYAVNFPISSLRVSNPNVKPIKGINLSKDAHAVGASVVGKKGLILTTTAQSIKVTDLDELQPRSRGAKGVIIQRLGAKDGNLTSMFAGDADKLIATDLMGNTLMLPKVTPRALTGTRFPTLGLIVGNKELPLEINSDDISNE